MPRRSHRVVPFVVVVLAFAALAALAAAAGPSVRVTGRVVDPEGKPVTGVRVRALPRQEMDLLKDPAAWRGCRAVTGEDGRFELEVPAGRPFRLSVLAHGFAPAAVDLDAAEKGPVEAGEIRLAEGARVSLVLVDEEDRPVSRVPFDLRVRGASRRDDRTLGQDDGAWQEGRLVVSGLPPGTWKLELEAGGHAAVDLGEVELVAGKTTDLGKVVLRRGPAIEGVVLSPDGEPVAGASVTARSVGAMAVGRAGWKETRTGKDGRFLLGGLAEGTEYTVAVDPPEGATWEGTAKPGDRLEVRLAVPGEISGRAVVGGEEGGPATPLVVRYRRLGREEERLPPGFPAVATSRWMDDRRTFRDEDGSFHLRDLAPGTYRLVLEHPRALARTLEKVEVAPGETVDLGTVTLDPGIELSGTVVDAATGDPVPGAIVEPAANDPFAAMAKRMDAADGEPGTGARTDGKGRFTLGGLEPGRVVLEVRAEGYATARAETVLEEDAAPEPLRVELSGGGVVEGVVRRKDGTPAAGVKVMVMRGMMPDLDHSAETDAAGHYRLEHLDPGPTTIVAMLVEPGTEGFDPSGLQVRAVTVEAGKTIRVDFPERAGGIVLSGRVLEEGRPVPAQLTFVQESGGLVSAKVDEEGRYRVELPAPGTWSVAVMRLAGRNEREAGETRVLVASTTTRIEVPENVPALTRDIHLPAATVLGAAHDPEGNPVAGATVVLRPADEDETASAPVARTGRDGTFRLRWVPEGTWTLVAMAPRHAWQETGPIDVGEKGEVEVDVTLPPVEPVPVRVADPSGNPVPGARVLVLDAPVPDLGPLVGAGTDENGLLQLDTLPEGSWQVAAVSPRFGLALREVLAPAPEGEVQAISFEETAPVTLLVRDEGGKPVRGARLGSLRPANGPEALPAVALAGFLLGRQQGPVSDGDGRLSLPPLPPGKWTGNVRCPGVEEPVSVRFRVAGTDEIEVETTCPGGA